MAEFRTISPTASYALTVPEAVLESQDDRTVSLWLEDDNTLLQVSSYQRGEGVQVPARERLRRRQRSEASRVWHDLTDLQIPGCPDAAASSSVDLEGVMWLFVYAVWRDLAVLVTISRPGRDPVDRTWAFSAMLTLKRNGAGTA